MRASSFHRLSLLGLLLLGACAPRTLTPATVPEAIAPQVELGEPPPPGRSRLVIDVVEGPVAVERVRMRATPITAAGETTQRFGFHEADEMLCPTTPCVLDVEPGNLLLRFPVLGNDEIDHHSELVHVGPKPSVYRRRLDQYEEGRSGLVVAGIVFALVGVSGSITGAVLAAGADDDSNRALGGGITAGVGLAMLVFGSWLARLGAPTIRPGSSVHFEL